MKFNYPTKSQYKIRDPLVILGNGPSLARVDLDMVRGFDSVGINMAYREFQRINFWPKYLAVLDHIIARTHTQDIDALIQQHIPNSIEAFFISHVAFQNTQLHTSDNVHAMPGATNTRAYPKDTSLQPTFENLHKTQSAAMAMVEIGMCLGYKQLVLLGIDSHYVAQDRLQLQQVRGCLGRVVKPELDKNHWFDDYYKVGDKLWCAPQWKSIGYKRMMAVWGYLKTYADAHDVEIVNGNPGSAVKNFPIMAWQEALQYFMVK